METNPAKQCQRFYRDYSSGQWSMSELCDRYQISRPTGYKWIDRLETEGLKAVALTAFLFPLSIAYAIARDERLREAKAA